MLDEDYAKLKEFVLNGGTLFTGLPQFSTHVKRDFLKEMDDLALWNNGDLNELCGFKVKGRSAKQFVTQFNTALELPEVELSAIPSASPEEDGSCYIADIELNDAEVVVWDADCGLPLLVKHNLGKGTVYVLTLYAYPGHERLQKLSAAITAYLAGESRGEIHVEDISGEVFWNVRRESESVSRINLLNTDWSEKDNVKMVTVTTPSVVTDVAVKERRATLLTALPFAILECPSGHFIEVVEAMSTAATLRLHGADDAILVIYRPDGVEERTIANSGICCEVMIQ
jgi:hypothetical protein